VESDLSSSVMEEETMVVGSEDVGEEVVVHEGGENENLFCVPIFRLNPSFYV